MPNAAKHPCRPPTFRPKDEALAKAEQLFADWGYDVGSYQFDEPYADEWGASVNASLVLDGMKAPIMLSVGFGENGAITYASGSLAEPQRGDDYPTIGAAAGLERLKTQQNQYVGLDSVSARQYDARPVSRRGAATDGRRSSRLSLPTWLLHRASPRRHAARLRTRSVRACHRHVEQRQVRSHHAVGRRQHDLAAAGLHVRFRRRWPLHRHRRRRRVHPTSRPGCPGQRAGRHRSGPRRRSRYGRAGRRRCRHLRVHRAAHRCHDPASTSLGPDWVGRCLSDDRPSSGPEVGSRASRRQDGVDLPITADAPTTRVNVAVKGDIVSEIVDIG